MNQKVWLIKRFLDPQIITANFLGLSNPDSPKVKCCSWSFVKPVISRWGPAAYAILFKLQVVYSGEGA